HAQCDYPVTYDPFLFLLLFLFTLALYRVSLGKVFLGCKRWGSRASLVQGSHLARLSLVRRHMCSTHARIDRPLIIAHSRITIRTLAGATLVAQVIVYLPL